MVDDMLNHFHRPIDLFGIRGHEQIRPFQRHFIDEDSH